MNDDEIIPDSSLLETLKDTYSQIEERESIPYDGVNGKPPIWVPGWAILYFEGYRNRLLKVRGYAASELFKWIERYKKVYLKEVGINSNVIPYMKCPATYPNGNNVDGHCFLDEIGFLAWLSWCVNDLDEETAKEQLNIGFSIADASDKGLSTQKEMRSNSKDFVFRTAQSIWNDQAKEGKSIYTVPVMAKKMLKKLKEEAKEGKVKYFIPKDSVMPRWINQALKDGKLTKPEG